MTDFSHPQLRRGAALYLAVVQFFFVTTWTIYVIYLPQLLVAAGLPASYTLWILMLDQLVFMVMDVVPGMSLFLIACLILALATFSRMGAAPAQLNKIADYIALLAWGPVMLWLAGGSDYLKRYRYEGRVNGDTMEGTVRGDGNAPRAEMKWRATHSK